MTSKLCPKEAERIAKEYGVEVPEDMEVDVVPRGVGQGYIHRSRKEVVLHMRRVYRRQNKFQRAKEKQNGRAQSLPDAHIP